MEKNSIESRIIELKTQLTEVINKIEIERQESKDDEQVILDELLGQKGIIEEELQELENSLCDIKIDKHKLAKYSLKKDGKKIDITIVHESLVDSSKGFISKNSPLAKALSKVKAGEIFKFSTPMGESEYKLVAKN